MKTWWAQKWLAAFGADAPGPADDVFEFFTVEPGEIKAKRDQCFVKIAWPAIPGESWEALRKEMKGRAIWAAKLMSGEMPETLEPLFQGKGLKLFPEAGETFRLVCSEDGESVFCRHVSAAVSRFARDFSESPLLLFDFRGKKGADLLRELHNAPVGGPRQAPRPEPVNPASEQSGRAAHFWKPAVEVRGLASRALEKVQPARPWEKRSAGKEASAALMEKAGQKRGALLDDTKRRLSR
ncbi:MAG TPA: hypothetical protein VL688_08615 [Verrucomicrobiae bacterium]|jgi:uncharacterized Zn finger protein|nr:hypothetical protein [Verrucomicrobiae bacterium]